MLPLLSINSPVWLHLSVSRVYKLLPDHNIMSQTGDEPFQELLDTLCQVLSTAQPTGAAPASALSPIYSASPMINPVPYSGSAGDCNGFLIQYLLTLDMQLHCFPTERSKISFILSMLTCHALQWAEPLWQHDGPATQFLETFIAHFCEVFSGCIPVWKENLLS